MAFKLTIIGGGGVRTPLLLHGLASANLDIGEIVLYDIDHARAETMAKLGRELTRIPICTTIDLENAVDGAAFVLSSIRVGGIAARARDERMSIEHGYAGQETTGPGGAAMALRTVPVILEQARVIERVAPKAWYISFTNPAGLISQAVASRTNLRAIGICDTPSELFHNISTALGGHAECDYAGLNHLGWVSRVRHNGADVTARLLNDESVLRRLYSADLFDPQLIRTLGLIPTEYLFFYYSQRRALDNQRQAGSTRGAEIEKMNATLFDELAAQSAQQGIETYRRYLNRRNASYMKLEAESGSAFTEPDSADANPFASATGYHRIAVEVLRGLNSDTPHEVVVNVANRGAIDDLAPDDVVEVSCAITRNGAVPKPTGRLPESVRGLVLGVKAYERTLIRAAVARSRPLAQLALLEYPMIGQWEPAGAFLDALLNVDPALAYLR